VTLVNEVGVDIEVINPSIVDDDLAAQTLTKYELECFKNLPSDQRIELFYKCWTGKEAFAKAQGDGLITNPNEIEMLSNKTIFIDKCERNLEVTETPNYSYFDLPSIGGYATGLVIMGIAKKHLRLFRALI
jgi:phosphopantetheine--protein transferase-like protein